MNTYLHRYEIPLKKRQKLHRGKIHNHGITGKKYSTKLCPRPAPVFSLPNCSSLKKKINYRLVLSGLSLQFLIAILICARANDCEVATTMQACRVRQRYVNT
ncbi:MAG: hypothetical protein EOP49_27730 [Sphingobacteriales bacterium]|nr:MAG: hypothetical protein EOP49_27730 [Sphingobacteriales bacterium]